MRMLIYFAVTQYNEYIYLSEQKLPQRKNQCRFVDLINDTYDLKNELNWATLNPKYKPNAVGIYEAVIEYTQTAEDDYSLNVIGCAAQYKIPK